MEKTTHVLVILVAIARIIAKDREPELKLEQKVQPVQ